MEHHHVALARHAANRAPQTNNTALERSTNKMGDEVQALQGSDHCHKQLG